MNTRDQKSEPHYRRLTAALVLLIIVVAVALRLYRLDVVPPGLQHDEAFHGHDAVTVLLGYHPIYFPSNAGNEPLYIYLTAGTIALFGQNAWGIRLAAVICGLAAVGFTGLWIRRAYNTRVALIASALVAVTFWPLFMSRAGLRSAALPPLAAATAWLFWRVAQVSGIRYQVLGFAAAGVLLGATLYTYPASRVLPIVYLLFVCAFYVVRFTFHTIPNT
jgi:4-amino-4-deoxy-L-arabinose transferase-like glycosyltransferase